MATFATTVRNNPLLRDWTAESRLGLPPFGEIKSNHFKPAVEVGMRSHLHELQQLVDNPETPTFDNTIAAFDRAGGVLSSVGMIFSNLCSSNAPPELQAVQLELAPVFAAHETKVFTFPGLYPRIASVFESCSTLSSEQQRLVDRVHLDFVRAGAKLTLPEQKRYGEIMEKMSTLQTQFQQNVMADESEVYLDLTADEMAGCPEFLLAAAKSAAEEKKKGDGAYVITLSRSLVEPFLTFSPRRDLREKAWRLWSSRGQLDPARDNLSIAKEILLLRVEQAALLGYETFADYQTADCMSKTPSKVMELLERVWTPACASANKERGHLEEYLRKQTGDASATVESWDWRFAAENVRKEKFNFDESLLKPFLSLPSMQKALFSTVEKLFGLRFIRVPDAVAYHPDVETYEVRETTADGQDKLVAVFLHDNYARANKQSGAWMSAFREQTRNKNIYSFAHLSAPDANLYPGESSGEAYVNIAATPATPNSQNAVPLIINNNNFAKGSPCLLSFDDCITLFHEMGHGLHGMLSDVTYTRLGGTNVLRDFVELPSQLLEHWLRSTNEVLQEHAKHFETGEIVSTDMLAKLANARTFNQGFASVEYTICAILDQALHALPKASVESLDIQQFEEKELQRLGIPSGISMRHRPAHFQHLFASSSCTFLPCPLIVHFLGSCFLIF